MPSFTVFKGSKNGSIVQATTTKPDVGAGEVLVRVTHSGLCGTDVHYKEADMGLGHEGVGVVEAVGSGVTLFKKGDRAGWGYNHGSCLHCDQCMTGNDIFCPERKMYGEADLDQGSMASHAVWREDFLFQIPEEMSSEDAAPMQCGGITVYTALMQYPVVSGERIGVVGIGGLGHLAIQFAAKMGCEVVVFSGTDSKKDEAFNLGAKEFHAMKGVKELKLEKGIDRLLVTTASPPDWSIYQTAMNPRGIIYPLGLSNEDLQMPFMPLLLQGLRIQGSVVGSRYLHKNMLTFAALHNIRPITQTFPMTTAGIEDAFKTLNDGSMRYRGVLVSQ